MSDPRLQAADAADALADALRAGDVAEARRAGADLREHVGAIRQAGARGETVGVGDGAIDGASERVGDADHPMRGER